MPFWHSLVIEQTLQITLIFIESGKLPTISVLVKCEQSISTYVVPDVFEDCI